MAICRGHAIFFVRFLPLISPDDILKYSATAFIIRSMEKQGRFVKGDLAVVTSASAALDQSIEDSIYTIRGVQVILDTDIAELYGIETKRLNEQVRRNASRFPSDFMFQLTQDEFVCLRSQNATTNWSKRRSMPYAFTELGVSMLSSVLSSEAAIQANIQIMRAFAAMRRFLVSNAQIFQRLDVLEYKQIATDQRVDRLFEKLEEGKLEPRQGIFFEDQVFDAYGFVSNLIKQAKDPVIPFLNLRVLSLGLHFQSAVLRFQVCIFILQMPA